MPSEFKVFGLPIEQTLNESHLGLPDRSMVSQFRIDNHDYRRIRCTWSDAKAVFEFEQEILKRLHEAADLDQEYFTVSDELYDDEDQILQGLDLGVASVVLVLAAMGCVTVTSCNGGVFGDSHHEEYPLIVFYAQAKDTNCLLDAAKTARVGILNQDGPIMVWANDIWHMQEFARQIMKQRKKL